MWTKQGSERPLWESLSGIAQEGVSSSRVTILSARQMSWGGDTAIHPSQHLGIVTVSHAGRPPRPLGRTNALVLCGKQFDGRSS